MTLRLRLSMLAVALVAAGLLAAGIATRYELRGFLIDRVDSQLQSATNPVSLYFERGDTDHGAQGQVLGVLPPGSYAAVVTGSSTWPASQYFGAARRPANLKQAVTQAPLGHLHPGRLPRVRDTRPGRGRPRLACGSRSRRRFTTSTRRSTGWPCWSCWSA